MSSQYTQHRQDEIRVEKYLPDDGRPAWVNLEIAELDEHGRRTSRTCLFVDDPAVLDRLVQVAMDAAAWLWTC